MSDDFGILRLPAQVSFGVGSRESLIPTVLGFGRRVFVVADGFLVGTDSFRALMSALVDAGVTVTVNSDVIPELPTASIAAVAEAARSVHPDVIVGYGGGSALDLAKLVALLVKYPAPLETYYGENAVPGPVLPLIALPTTAGTGSEVTPVAVVADPERTLKIGISDPALIPRVALVDPELTVGAPAAVTAHSGIDALVHAVESLTAGVRQPDWQRTLPVFVGRNRLTSLVALEAVRAIGGALATAVHNGDDLSARERMSWGSLLAGMAFGSAGTHLSHAIQYPIGALTHTPHGLGTGLLLPYVLQATRRGAVGPLASIAEALGVQAHTDEASSQAAIDAIAALTETIGIPNSLAEIGITEDELPQIVELSLGVKRLAGNAPQPPTPELVKAIVYAAFRGDRDSLRTTIS